MHPDGNAHGGTALIIKNSIKHHELTKYKKQHLQATCVVIEDWQGPLTVAAVYCPPRHSIKKEEFEEFFDTLGNRFLAAGDYNAKHTHWGSRLITPKGRQLYMAMRSRNCKHISTGEPTYWPTDRNKSPDLIDFGITKSIPHEQLNAKSSSELSSDHSPVQITLSTNIIENNKPPFLTNKFTNWNHFRELLDNKLDLIISLRTEIEVDEAVQYLTKTIQECCWQTTPEIKSTHSFEELPVLIRDKITNKRRLRKRWQITRTPEDKTTLNRATQELKRLLNEHKNDGIKFYLSNLTPTEATEYSLWKAAKKIHYSQAYNTPIRQEDGQWAKSSSEKAALFARHLEKVFQPFPQSPLDDSEEEINAFLSTPFQMQLPPANFTVKQVTNAIAKRLNPKKAPGYDMITARILQELSHKAKRILTFIFNACIKLNYFPAQWKVAVIILIPKPGKPVEDIKSYRPISLLPVMSKLFEKLLIDRLQPIIEQDQLIPDHQFGFRHQHATIEQIHRVAQKIRQDLEHKKYCAAAFLDITQAFDRVWHAGLLYKLRKALPLPYFLILKSYLADRHFLVNCQGETSSIHKIESGVPQGSVLGPLLYLLYTADLPTSDRSLAATFADDTVILASHKDNNLASDILQNHLHKMEQWLNKWRIRANETKSVQVTFTNRRGDCPPVTLNNLQLPQRDEAKYLGMHLDRRLTWRKHIFTKRKQLGLKFRQLHWMIGRQSALSINNKLLVYKAILKPIWTYGIQLWGTASTSNIEILERFQAKVLRTVVNAPWFVPNSIIARDLQVKSVKSEISDYSKNYSTRLRSHPNSIASNLMTQPAAQRRLKRHTPYDLITRF